MVIIICRKGGCMCEKTKTPVCVSCILINPSVTINIICVSPVGSVTHSLGLCQLCKQKAIQIADSIIMFAFMAPLVQVISFFLAFITRVLKLDFLYTTILLHKKFSLSIAQKLCFTQRAIPKEIVLTDGSH